MKNFYFSGRASRLALVLGAAALSGCVFAPGHGEHRPRQVLEGTWMTTVSAAPGQPTPFLSIVTYTPTGQSLEENNTPQIRGLGHGEWKRTGRGEFQRTMTFFIFGGARTYAGVARVVSNITLEPGGNSYNEVSRFERSTIRPDSLLPADRTPGTPTVAASALAFLSAWVSSPRRSDLSRSTPLMAPGSP